VLTAPLPAGLLARSPGLLAPLSGPLLAPCTDCRAWFRHPAIPARQRILRLFPQLSLRAHHSIPIAPAFRCGFAHRVFSPSLRPTPPLLPDSVRRETGQKIYAVTALPHPYLLSSPSFRPPYLLPASQYMLNLDWRPALDGPHSTTPRLLL